MLTGEPGEAQPEADPAPSPAFRLPLRNVTNANILNYLTQERKLSPSLVNFFIAAGDIYEDAASHHNVVFVGRDADGHPATQAAVASTRSSGRIRPVQKRRLGLPTVAPTSSCWSLKRPSTCCPSSNCSRKLAAAQLSVAGRVSGKALRQFLSERPDVERVFLCLDADKAGEDACKRLAALLPDTVSVTRIQPCMKGLERCSGAPGRDSEPQLFQKHRSERAAEKGFCQDHPHERRGTDPGGMALEAVSAL